MLTEAEKKWLERREKTKENNGYYFCAHSEIQSAAWNTKTGWADVPWVIDTKDTYKAAAEFESRVAARLAETAGDIALLLKQAGLEQLSDWQLLRIARLAVEEEMQ